MLSNIENLISLLLRICVLITILGVLLFIIFCFIALIFIFIGIISDTENWATRMFEDFALF